ncbi:MAG: DUF4175 family protein [Flavobacteriales bacterium]
MNAPGGLIKKLDGFIRAYYLNKVVNGLLISAATLIASLFFFAILEHFGHFGTIGRKTIFWFFIAGGGLVIARWVFIPLAQWARIGPGLSHENASKIIGTHFPEISDRLLNVLQLQQQLGGTLIDQDTTLLQASIDERTRALKPISFTRAIDWNRSRRLLKYAIPVIAVALAIMGWKPELVKEPTSRIIAYEQDFVPPPPFVFELLNETLRVPADQPLTIEVKTIGDTRPDVAMIHVGENRYRMGRTPQGNFEYTFPLVRENTPFQIFGAGVSSEVFEVQVLPVPTLIGIEIIANPPRYTGLERLVQSDMGDLRVPEGAQVEWRIKSANTDSLRMNVCGKPLPVELGVAQAFSASTKADESGYYWIIPSNADVGAMDSMRYQLTVIPDQYPRISTSEKIDSSSVKRRFFNGEVSDDYGISRISFVYQWLELGGEEEVSSQKEGSRESNQPIRVNIPSPKDRIGRFFYDWNMAEMVVMPGDVIEYWFEVYDNDGLHGAKMARSTPKIFSAPTEDEIKEQRDETNDEIEDRMASIQEDVESLIENTEALKRQLAEDSELDWKDQRALEELVEKQQELEKELEDLQNINQTKDDRSNEFSPEDERLMEKQEQLQELMEQVMSEELKEMYEEMQRLMGQLDQESIDQIQEQLQNMQVDQESLEKELDRALEQFKQLEYEVKMEEAIEALKELAEKQAELSEKTKNNEGNQEQLMAEQDSLNNEFQRIQDELDELDQANEELQNPNPTMDREEERESIQEKLNDSSDQLKQEKNKKASDSQKSASEEMQQMAEQMENMMQQSSEESMEMDMDALRALLENIIQLSFDEESLMADLKKTSSNDPAYVLHGQTQRRLKDDAKMVEDSLFELSLRIPQIAPAVNREIGLINHHMEQALGGFGDRETSMITSNQQYVMTSFNNLALMLDDALQQMQQSMANQQPGSGNCENPGGNGKPKPSPSAGDLKKMQQALGDRLQKMKEMMGEGANAGNSGKEKKQLSKELAQIAAKQAALRQMAEQKAQEMNADGSGNGSEMNEIAKEMEQLERDLVNKNVTPETLLRQQELMTRLLEAENAELMRGEDDQRKAKKGDQNLAVEPPPLLEYLQLKDQEAEWLRTIPLELDPYYRDRVNDYFNNLGLSKPDFQPEPQR